MKKLFYMISVAAFMASFSSCGKIEQENTPVVNTPADGFTTLAISATVPQTKTYLSAGKVKWVKDDFIWIFAEDGSYKKTDGVAQASATYDFTVTDWPADKTPLYAVYSGQSEDEADLATYMDGAFTITVPTIQIVNHKNSFAKTANRSIGELLDGGTSYSIAMKNIGGLFKFTISTDQEVSSVKIEDVNGAALAGKVNVTLVDHMPKAEVVDKKTDVTIKSNVGNIRNFPKADYYACVLPGTYTLKVTVTFTDGTTKVLEAKSPVTVNRNECKDLGVIDMRAIKFNLDFTSRNVFEEEMAYFGEKATYIENPHVYHYVLDGVEYAFNICSSGYGWTENTDKKTSTDYPCFRMAPNSKSEGGDWGYIQLPGIDGYKLITVEIEMNNTAQKYYYLSLNNPVVNGIDGLDKITLPAATLPGRSSKTVTVKNPVVGESYYLYSMSANASLTKLVLTYSK